MKKLLLIFSLLFIFIPFSVNAENQVWDTSFSNDEIEISNLSNYGFEIGQVREDNNNVYYLSLKDDNSNAFFSINNIHFSGKEYFTIDDLYVYLIGHHIETKHDIFEYASRTVKTKILSKNAVIVLRKGGWGTILEIYIEAWKNHFQKIYIYENALTYKEALKSKSFLNALRVVLNEIEIKEHLQQNEYSNDFSFGLDMWFYIIQDYFNYKIISTESDILVDLRTAKRDLESFGFSDFSSYIKDQLEGGQDYYINDYWIKETSNWEYYWYVFLKNNERKSWDVQEWEKKYLVSIVFFNKLNDTEFNRFYLNFEFDNPESKQKIDELINSIKTKWWELPFELWDANVWENMMNEPDFEIID